MPSASARRQECVTRVTKPVENVRKSPALEDTKPVENVCKSAALEDGPGRAGINKNLAPKQPVGAPGEVGALSG